MINKLIIKIKVFFKTNIIDRLRSFINSDKPRQLVEILKANKLLVVIALLTIFILAMIISTTKSFNGNGSNVDTNTSDTSSSATSGYEQLKVTKSFIYYKMDGKYYVFSYDLSKNNKEIIRNTLGIAADIDFEIVYPKYSVSESITPIENQDGLTIGD